VDAQATQRRAELATQGIHQVDNHTGEAQARLLAQPWWLDWTAGLFPVIVVVFLLRSFLFEPFKIPSGSMIPTLLVGDLILVNKFHYGVRLPVLNTKIFANGEPKRGDVVVFRYPGKSELDPEKGADYIKRIIGVPGDTIDVSDDQVRINGQAVAYKPAGVFVGTGAGLDDTGADIVQEMLPGKTHTILDIPGSPFPPSTWVVPKGEYFAMGDNRDHSADSREWGFFPEHNLVGRAMVIWLNCEGWFCSDGFDYSRIGDTIR